MTNTIHNRLIMLFLSMIFFSISHNIEAQSTEAPLNSYIGIFEIPATDINRAVAFYENILMVNIQRYEFPEMEIGVFPYEDQMVTGLITKGEGFKPSTDGITIYLNAGDDLQPMLDRVPENGGRVIISKTPHADNNGFFAIFIDSEGNKLGLHSPN